MNKINVYAIYDSKSKFYRFKYECRTHGEALRAFITGANDIKTEIGRHPADFTLFHVAQYEDESATFQNICPPENLGLALHFVEAKNILEEKNG